MTFLDLQKEVAEACGLDLTESATATRVKRWINSVYQYISGLYDWSWLESREVIPTVTDITTGTLTATNASTSITFSSAPAASVAGRYLQTSDSDDWYLISAHTAGETGATLETAYVGTGGSGLTYTVRKLVYSVSSSLDRIISVRQFISPSNLGGVMQRRFDRFIPEPNTTGSPYYYTAWGLDSSKNWQISFYPIPDEVMLIEIRSLVKITELSADGDTPLMPAKFNECLIQGSLVKGFQFTSDMNQALLARKNFGEMIQTAIEEDGQNRDEMRVMQAADARSDQLTAPRLPSSYGDLGEI